MLMAERLETSEKLKSGLFDIHKQSCSVTQRFAKYAGFLFPFTISSLHNSQMENHYVSYKTFGQ